MYLSLASFLHNLDLINSEHSSIAYFPQSLSLSPSFLVLSIIHTDLTVIPPTLFLVSVLWKKIIRKVR